MTKQTGTIDVSSFTTDAKFRTWGLACSTALQACGLTKTTDTGQVNWATVTKPVAINTKATSGYEIYRFADTLQSTKPVFLRIDFGSGGVASGNSPCTWLTVGTGTDGAGTITGANTGSLQGCNMGGAPTNTAMTYRFTNTSNGYLLMSFGDGLTNASVYGPGFWIVARTVNKTTGAATGDGVVIHRIMYTASFTYGNRQYGLDFNTGTAFSAGTDPQTSLPNLQFSAATGASIPVGKTYMLLNALYATDATLCYYTGDITGFTTFSASPWGLSHTYMAWPTASGGTTPGGVAYFDSYNLSGASGSVSAGACLATIWED